MKEKYDDEIEINTNSSKLLNINNVDDDIKEKLLAININSPLININSTSDDDSLLINNEINLANSNNTDYIQPSLPKSFSSIIDKINDFDDINNISPRESRISILETFDEKLNTTVKFNIRDISLIPLSILNEKSVSLDCYNGIGNAPSPLLSEFMKVDKDTILSQI